MTVDRGRNLFSISPVLAFLCRKLFVIYLELSHSISIYATTHFIFVQVISFNKLFVMLAVVFGIVQLFFTITHSIIEQYINMTYFCGFLWRFSCPR